MNYLFMPESEGGPPGDPASLEWLRATALRTAAALDDVAELRRHAARTDLARCHGAFADDLAVALHRAAADEVELAEACRHLARTAERAAGSAAAGSER